MRAGWRRALLAGGLSAAIVLCTPGRQPLHRTLAQGVRVHGPSGGVTASPTMVDLQAAPRDTMVDLPTAPRDTMPDLQVASRGTGHQQPPTIPDLYPGGEDRLDQEKAAAMQLPPSPGIRTVSTAAPRALAAASLSSGTGFDGIDAAESFCGCKPPDGAIAASPAYLLATVNTAFNVWDKSGHPLLGGPTSLSGLFGGCLATYPHMSDPFTDYDATDQRFVLGILTYDDVLNSSICVAVSQTSDPTRHWNVYSFPVSSTPNNSLLDFPRAAIGSNAIYVGGNLFQYQPGNPFCPNGFCFLGAGLYAYDKTAMYQGQPAHDLGYTVSGYDSLMPARTAGLSDPAYSSGTEYFTAADNTCPLVTCNTIRLWKWNAFSGAAPTYQGSVTVSDYGEPPNAVQPGTSATIDTNDARELGTYWAYDTANGDTIYGAHTIGCNPGGGTVACVQWYRLGHLDTTPVLLQQGILAGNGQYRFFPNLAVDSAGDLTIGYAYSSSSEYAGIRYTGLASDGAPEPEAVLKAGEGTIDGSRYGDFAGEVVDPDGCTIWHFEEYARAGSLWGTWAGSFTFSSCAGTAPTATPPPTNTAVPPTSTPMLPTSTPTNTVPQLRRPSRQHT